VLIRKGDKVRLKNGGPTMEVLAAGTSLAICEWMDGSLRRTDVFDFVELEAPTVAQQAQQPQATPAPQR